MDHRTFREKVVGKDLGWSQVHYLKPFLGERVYYRPRLLSFTCSFVVVPSVVTHDTCFYFTRYLTVQPTTEALPQVFWRDFPVVNPSPGLTQVTVFSLTNTRVFTSFETLKSLVVLRS